MPDPVNPQQKMITVRLPEELHAALKVKADTDHFSLNRLCVRALEAVLTTPPAAQEGDAGVP